MSLFKSFKLKQFIRRPDCNLYSKVILSTYILLCSTVYFQNYVVIQQWYKRGFEIAGTAGVNSEKKIETENSQAVSYRHNNFKNRTDRKPARLEPWYKLFNCD